MKKNYIAISKQKKANGQVKTDVTYVPLPTTQAGLRKTFGNDTNYGGHVVRVCKNGVVYTSDKNLGHSVKYVPRKTKSR